jgi:hypothetical protein
MNLKAADWIALASFIASGGLATLVQIVGQTWPAHAVQIANVAAIVAGVAGVVVRLYANKTGAPSTAIVANAAIVPVDTTVVHADTQTIATNVVAALKGP